MFVDSYGVLNQLSKTDALAVDCSGFRSCTVKLVFLLLICSRQSLASRVLTTACEENIYIGFF